jgi:hypothetical protein
MYNGQLCIVIPHHRECLYSSEFWVLKNLCDKLANKYPIYLFLPAEVKPSSPFQKLIDENSIKIKVTDGGELSSYGRYNTFLCRSKFYEYFKEYEYMLLFQLDGWILENKLDYFVSLKYDFIGAPIFKHQMNTLPQIIPGGGNGGVTLRNIQSSLKVLNQKNKFFSAKSYFKAIGYDYRFTEKPLKFLIKKYLSYFLFFSLDGFLWPFHLQEDVFWSLMVPNLYPEFKVPPVSISADFCFDLYPREVFTINQSLPSFLHAWEKNNDGFFSKLTLDEKGNLQLEIAK